MLVMKRLNGAGLFSIIAQLIAISLLAVPYISRDVIVSSQDSGGFELPVQLIGFPVIVLAVRTSNFVRKLSYALNPSTYRRSARATRAVDLSSLSTGDLDFRGVDKELLRHLGPDFCVYENTCLKHAENALAGNKEDWTEIINNFSALPHNKQQYYLLSVFLGNMIRSKNLCQHFQATSRNCQ